MNALRVASVLLLTLGLCGLASPARSLILDVEDAKQNALVPSPDPGWHYVGHRLGGPTVIYVGYGWVLTASHVGVGVVVFEGKKFDPIKGSDVRIRNRDGSPADLVVYQIASPPPLPPLPIAQRTPRIGQVVTLIGIGRLRGPTLTLDIESKGLMDGYHWLSDSDKRWGTNSVAAKSLSIELAGTRTLAVPTVFNRLDDPSATDFEAQAAEGDSGGGLFADASPLGDKPHFALAGIMFTVSNWTGQPRKTTFYGDLTYSADLAEYRDQIISIIRPACSNGLDDDADGLVDYADDPDCRSSADREEKGATGITLRDLRWPMLVLAVLGLALVVTVGIRALHARHEPPEPPEPKHQPTD
jgi:hypothetical protein